MNSMVQGRCDILCSAASGARTHGADVDQGTESKWVPPELVADQTAGSMRYKVAISVGVGYDLFLGDEYIIKRWR
jgi:hypothetical protein